MNSFKNYFIIIKMAGKGKLGRAAKGGQKRHESKKPKQ